MLALLIALLLGTPAPKVTFQQGSTGPKAVLTWNPSKTAGVTYNVYGGTASGKESATPIATGLTSPAYTDSSALLVPSQPVCYYVNAQLNSVVSLPSNEWCGTVPIGAPSGLGGTTSASLAPFSVTPLPAQCVASKANTFTFTNTAIPAQSGQFQLTIMMTPTAGPATAGYVSGPTDGVAGLSSGPINAYGSYAALVRANPQTGYFDSYNGTDYGTPAAKVVYVSGIAYRVTFVVNTSAQTYSAYVDGTLIASNYKFRTAAKSLANVALVSETGAVKTCANVAV